MWTYTRLEVAERVDGLAVDADFEVEVGAGAEAGAADVTDHLALADVLADGDGDLRLVGVGGGETAAVVYALCSRSEVALPIVCGVACGSFLGLNSGYVRGLSVRGGWSFENHLGPLRCEGG